MVPVYYLLPSQGGVCTLLCEQDYARSFHKIFIFSTTAQNTHYILVHCYYQTLQDYALLLF